MSGKLAQNGTINHINSAGLDVTNIVSQNNTMNESLFDFCIHEQIDCFQQSSLRDNYFFQSTSFGSFV